MTNVRRPSLDSRLTPMVGEAPTGRSRRAQQAIQDRIKDLILERHLRSGDPMPTEAELIAHLAVSRNTVREALKSLQAMRIVEIRHGLGTYVGDCALDPLADALAFRGRQSLRGDRHELFEILDVRQVLETGLVTQIVDIAGETDVAALAECLADMERAANGPDDEFTDADRSFHEQLYAPLDNQLLSQLLRAFWDVYHDLSALLVRPRGGARDIVETHRAIYDAVAMRDRDRARTAMETHFQGIRDRASDLGEPEE
jgi:DNA-binding FadR family transcriptional regulator